LAAPVATKPSTLPNPAIGKESIQKRMSTGKIPKLDTILEESKLKEESTQIKEEVVETYGDATFTEAELRKTWEDFAVKTKEEGRDSEYAVLKQEFRLENDHIIIITFTNSVKLMILEKFKTDLIKHLKSVLNNRHIKLETELKEEESSKIPYTNREKFEYLAEKKPILNELKDRLGLDPDF
jgi:DNA polymerase-3 subunit gamma/tau